MMKITKKKVQFILQLLMAMLVVLEIPQVCLADTEPIDQLQDSVSQIFKILHRHDPNEPWAEKKKEIIAIVKSRFDGEEMAQRVLAQYWRERSDEEKREFVSLFSQVLETTYINKLRSFSNEEVKFTKQIIDGDRAIVYSELFRHNREIPIQYRVKNSNGIWRAYDIIIEGVSLVQNYRTQFKQILKNEKYAALVQRMEEKIKENQAKDLEEQPETGD